MDLRLFVVSDLHAFDGSQKHDREPSFFDISKPENSGAENPIRDLKTLIAANGGIKADFLICCGDLGDKAVPGATERAWKELQELGKLLETKQIITTVGNHDVDSRHQHNDHDARGVLLELAPGFPFADESHNCHFWTHHFVTFNDPIANVRFVVVNSSAYHGEKVDEYAHGRVSERTMKRLKASLEKENRFPLNILICHHHPHKHSELKLGDYDDMRGGYELLNLIDSAKFGPWIVFHGHKHHPKISYAQGDSSTPVIFSAGSCAAIPGPDLLGHARNQVYLVHLKIPNEFSTNCCGEFISWDWMPGRGWDLSQIGSGLPDRGGFGYRGDIGELAVKISTDFPSGGKWRDVEAKMPVLLNLLPSDSRKLRSILKSEYDYRFEDGKGGNPILFEK
jgi:Icc-related predicted phosphoesterase